MIEPIHSASVTGIGRSLGAPAQGPSPIGAGAGEHSQAAGGTAVRTSADVMAALGPPIDADRVAELKGAIAEGSYAIDPQAIAAALIHVASEQR